MAKIELYKNKINNMPNIINNVRAEVSSYAAGLTKLYSKILAIDSPVVDKAIASLSTATKIQEEQISGLNATQRQIDAFVLTVQVTDNRVASCIRELTKMYKSVYNYSHDVSTDIATDSLAEWLYKNWGDRFTYGYALYNSEDLENMSQEEFDKYVEQLLALDYDSLSVEDETRIQAVLDYLSGVSINGNMSETDKKKVSQYNSIYEKLNPEEKIAMDTFFDNSSKNGIIKEDVSYIKYIAYKSEGAYHDIFFSYVSKMCVFSWNGVHKGKEYSSAYYGSFTDPDTNTDYGMICIDLNGDISGSNNADGINNTDGAYTTIFHEIGHGIDDYLNNGFDEDSSAKRGDRRFFTRDKLGGELYNAMYSDLRNIVTRVVNSGNESLGFAKLNDKSKSQVIDALLDGRKKWTTLNPYEKTVYNAIKAAIEGNAIFRNPGVSDIVGGLTNNTIAGHGGDNFSFTASGYGHLRYDWKDTNDNGWKDKKSYYWYEGNEATYNQLSEFFAEYTSYIMTGQYSKVEDFRKVFPNACEMLDRELSEM